MHLAPNFPPMNAPDWGDVRRTTLKRMTSTFAGGIPFADLTKKDFAEASQTTKLRLRATRILRWHGRASRRRTRRSAFWVAQEKVLKSWSDWRKKLQRMLWNSTTNWQKRTVSPD